MDIIPTITGVKTYCVLFYSVNEQDVHRTR